MGGGVSQSPCMGTNQGKIEAGIGHNTRQGLGFLVLLTGEVNPQGPPGAAL